MTNTRKAASEILATAQRLGATISLKPDGSLHLDGPEEVLSSMRPVIGEREHEIASCIISQSVMALAVSAHLDHQSAHFLDSLAAVLEAGRFVGEREEVGR